MSEFTVREFAERERVAERTVRRWVEKGAVDVRRTPGGGLRILAEVETRQNTTKPATLGHPSN